MKRSISIISLVLLGLTATMAAAAPKGDAVKGKALYAKTCASCHGAAGEGKEALAKALKVTIRALGSKEVQAKSDADLQDAILKGTGKMKPVKNLDEKQAADIVAHLRALAKK